MKAKVMVVLGALALSAPVLSNGSYCQGYRDGYFQLYREARLAQPATPACTAMPQGGGDPYRTGYRAGLKQAEREICKTYPSSNICR